MMIEVKHRNPKPRWANIPIILTSNSLPAVLRPPIRMHNETEWDFKEREILHGALMSRCKLVEVKVSHANSEQFPYTAKDLAVYMKHICDEFDKEGQVEVYEEPVVEEAPVREPRLSREEAIAQGYPMASVHNSPVQMVEEASQHDTVNDDDLYGGAQAMQDDFINSKVENKMYNNDNVGQSIIVQSPVAKKEDDSDLSLIHI